MYRFEDLDKIKINLDNIQDKAANEYKTFYEPTIKEIGDVYSSIINYIKRKKRITYGGFAQNIILINRFFLKNQLKSFVCLFQFN